MQWNFVVVMVLAVAVIAFPALLWFSEPVTMHAAMWEAKRRKAARKVKRFRVGAGEASSMVQSQ